MKRVIFNSHNCGDIETCYFHLLISLVRGKPPASVTISRKVTSVFSEQMSRTFWRKGIFPNYRMESPLFWKGLAVQLLLWCVNDLLLPLKVIVLFPLQILLNIFAFSSNFSDETVIGLSEEKIWNPSVRCNRQWTPVVGDLKTHVRPVSKIIPFQISTPKNWNTKFSKVQQTFIQVTRNNKNRMHTLRWIFIYSSYQIT